MGDGSDCWAHQAVVGRRILGIDPGSVVTGWGVVEAMENSLSHVACGTIATAGAEAQGARLHCIYRGIQQIMTRYRPDGVSLEKVFFARNPQSALKLGQARGVALLAAAENQLDVYEYSSNEIKSAVVGYGHATKSQVQKMVASLLNVSETLAADAADALAAAVCHIHRRAFQARIAEAAPDWRPALRRRRSR
ncbi:MAG TPA: crossover junction endodeoxyribonuclease RuvC [Candidatus Binatia bacterium]|nr:crossover junction endodeoxyribonuclease RuvC [Candidatus Binatia bacterium]